MSGPSVLERQRRVSCLTRFRNGAFVHRVRLDLTGFLDSSELLGVERF